MKVSVARKDEIVNELQIENKALQEKCVYLENMLEQQRKEYLIKWICKTIYNSDILIIFYILD